MALKAGDPERFAQITEAAVVAERMSLRLQFEAAEDDARTIEFAQALRRNAIGMKKAIEEYMQALETPTP